MPEITETAPDDQAGEFALPVAPAGDASAAEITELEEQCGDIADAAAARAERDQAEHNTRMEAARENAARMIADEEARTQPLADSAAGAQQAAAGLIETRRRLRTAADYAAKAEAAEATVRALEAEHDDLSGRLEDLGQRRGERAAELRELAARLAAATEAEDAATMTDVRNKLESARAIDAGLAGRQSEAQARLAELGDGEMSPIWPQKELAEARRVAHGARSQAAAALNAALPDRPEAVAARQRAHEQWLDRAEADQRAAERQAAQYTQPRTFVAGRR